MHGMIITQSLRMRIIVCFYLKLNNQKIEGYPAQCEGTQEISVFHLTLLIIDVLIMSGDITFKY